MSKEMTKNITSNLLNYLQVQIPNFRIDQEKREALCFRDRLDVYSKNNFTTKDTGPIGSYCISVESFGPENQEFLVHVFSSMKINGSLGGSKVISSATEELHCLEEKRNEFVETDNGILKKKLYLSKGDNYYSIKVGNDFLNNENQSLKIYYNETCKVITDGCNILLMRYLAITDFNGFLSFDFITIDGKIIVCNYECFCAKLMKIDNNNLDVYTIRQTFNEDGNIVHENKIFMTKSGKIIQFEWVDSFCIMKINFSYDSLKCNKAPIIMPLKETWQEDIELTSKYKDKKTDEIVKQEQYLSIHKEIYNLMADYVQTLLCRKPEDVLLFTINYFKTMANDPPLVQVLHEIKSNFWDNTDTTHTLKDEMEYLLINTIQHANNSTCSNSSCTKNTSSASLVSNYSTCSFCSSKLKNKNQCNRDQK